MVSIVREINVGQMFSAFRIFPSHAHALEIRGTLPKRPKGTVTREYIMSLAAYIEGVRGSLPDEAKELIRQL